MADARVTWWRMLARAAIGLVLATPICAVAGPLDGSDLSAWLARTTDLQSSQIALVSADSVYSLEPLGAPLPTGEIVVLVRTEPLADDWGATHGFRSWDANLLVDCAQRRLRVIRSATYPQRNRGGKPAPEPQDYQAKAPLKTEPAARLLAAACDGDFVWPLRSPTLATPRVMALAIDLAPEVSARTAGTAPRPPEVIDIPPGPAAASPAAAGTYAVQIARGPSEEGARRALARARKALGPLAQSARDAMPVSRVPGGHLRYDARLEGFPTQAAAGEACRKLSSAGQDCFLRQVSLAEPAPGLGPS